MLCGRVSGIFLGWWLDVSSEYSMGCLYSVVGLYLVSICIVAKKRDPGILDPELFLAQIRKVEARLGNLAKIRKVETD